MIEISELQFLKDTVLKTLKFEYDGSIILVDKDQVYVKYNDGIALISGNRKEYTARSIMLLAYHLSKGEKEFEVSEAPRFSHCGAIIDASRNGVMRVPAVKEYLNSMACLGMNTFMLYTEDTFEMKEYPYFGYRRGRYTKEELKEMDDHAFMLGIEIVPCIQTLGHMEQYLRFKESKDIRDTEKVLLCEEDKTYIFIENMIKTMRASLRSNRIYIGMDEAYDMGRGKYLDLHGYQNHLDVFVNHLNRVTKICEQVDYKPMMCSDMLFKIGAEDSGGFYDLNANVDTKKLSEIPDVEVIYWDYYHLTKEDYRGLIKNHQKIKEDIIFLGGIWTWCGLLPNMEYTYETMLPAMECCCEANIKQVFASAWGDDGTETNQMLSLAGLPIFSEYCYQGENCSFDHIKEITEFVTGLAYDELMAISKFHDQFIKGLKRDDLIFPNYMGKKIFYTDLFYNMTGRKNLDDFKKTYEEAFEILQKSSLTSKCGSYYDYTTLIFEINIIKCGVLSNLRTAYEEKNNQYLNLLSSKIIPTLIQKQEDLMKIHQEQWMSTYKVFGWETINSRYGIVITRLNYALEVIKEYLSGNLISIEELEFEYLEDPIEGIYRYGNMIFFKDLQSTSGRWQ